MRVARSSGNPYAPVEMAGNAIDRIVACLFDAESADIYRRTLDELRR